MGQKPGLQRQPGDAVARRQRPRSLEAAEGSPTLHLGMDRKTDHDRPELAVTSDRPDKIRHTYKTSSKKARSRTTV